VIKGQTAEDRLAFLRQAEQSAEQSNDLDYLNRLFAEALGDPSPQVRSYAAYGLRDSKYVAILITTMTIDPDRGVRQLASDGLDHWLTDNGVETCQDSATVEKNLNQLLKGLDDFYTVQNTVEILGARYSGGEPLVCCMSDASRNAATSALQGLKTKPLMHRGWASGFVDQALKNDSNCPAD
jgi:hypothetical protein